MTPHRNLLQQALDALDAITDDVDGTGLNTMPSFDKAIDAITALREALAAPEPEPVALESVHLTRDTRGMCVVRVNGRVAIRDNGDIIDHMATLEWFAAPPAAPAPAAPVVREPRHVRKVGGSFQHTGAVVAEFKTLAGEPRIVLEFDAPVAGMLHVYRPDQVEPCEPAAPAAPVVREPLRDDAFHAWVEEASADHPNLLERQEFRDAMYNAWINGYNTRVDEQANGITGGKP